MAPHSEETTSNGHKVKPVVPNKDTSAFRDENEVDMLERTIPSSPVFQDKYKEREYLKGRLAAAFRIFGKYGFDEGVAGHITLRVRFTRHYLDEPTLTKLLGSGGARHLLGESIRRRLLFDQEVRSYPGE